MNDQVIPPPPTDNSVEFVGNVEKPGLTQYKRRRKKPKSPTAIILYWTLFGVFLLANYTLFHLYRVNAFHDFWVKVGVKEEPKLTNVTPTVKDTTADSELQAMQNELLQQAEQAKADAAKARAEAEQARAEAERERTRRAEAEREAATTPQRGNNAPSTETRPPATWQPNRTPLTTEPPPMHEIAAKLDHHRYRVAKDLYARALDDGDDKLQDILYGYIKTGSFSDPDGWHLTTDSVGNLRNWAATVLNLQNFSYKVQIDYDDITTPDPGHYNEFAGPPETDVQKLRRFQDYRTLAEELELPLIAQWYERHAALLKDKIKRDVLGPNWTPSPSPMKLIEQDNAPDQGENLEKRLAGLARETRKYLIRRNFNEVAEDYEPIRAKIKLVRETEKQRDLTRLQRMHDTVKAEWDRYEEKIKPFLEDARYYAEKRDVLQHYDEAVRTQDVPTLEKAARLGAKLRLERSADDGL